MTEPLPAKRGRAGYGRLLFACAHFAPFPAVMGVFYIFFRKEYHRSMAEKLKIIPLGGLNEIGKNMTAYEYGGEIIVVDCGMAFPGDDMYGIDLIIPDVSYLIKNRARIRVCSSPTATRTTWVPFPMCSSRLNMPIYCTRFTAGLIKLKLEEHGLVKSTKLITVEPGKSVRAGKFTVEFIHVNHSIADSVAFAIHTHMGTIVHTGDFKIDSTPIDRGGHRPGPLRRAGEGGRPGTAGGLHQCGASGLHPL